MLVNSNLRLLVLLPARCGSTTVKEVLRNALPDCREVGPNHGRPGNFPPAWRRSFVKLCLARNPASRVVSLWSHWSRRDPGMTYRHALDREVNRRLTQRRLSFAEAVADPQVRKLLRQVCQPVTELCRGLAIDRFIRQERLETDLQELPVLQGRRLSIPHRHRSPEDEPWWTRYDDAARDWVASEYAADFARLGYSMEQHV